MPGTSCNASPIFSLNSLNVLADVHCFLGFKITIISLASMGIGSVGTSPLPILVTTFSTSGKRVNSILAACWVEAMAVGKLLPVNTLVSTAKSPSSNAGINSAPKRESNKTAPIKNTNTKVKIIFG